MPAPHILIAGGGVGGLTAALALTQNGAKVEVFEQTAALNEVGAGLQQGPNAMQVHAALGIDKDIEAAGFEPNSIEFRDFRTGKSLLSNPLKGAHEDRYGQKYLHIHRADLHNILLTAARKAGVTLHLNHAVESYKQDNNGVRVKAAGKTFIGDILIGADGIKSNIRLQMLGPEKTNYTGHVAWRGIVPANKLPAGRIPPCANNWLGPKRHFVSYYIRGGEFINFVAIEEREAWVEESWSHPGDMTELLAAFAGWDSRVTDLLDACETCFLWGLFDHPPLTGWTKGRTALLGDAAHPMLPFMAQGASMAIEDGWVLAQCIDRLKDNLQIALKTYEKARYARAVLLQKMSRENAKLYHINSPAQKFLRNTKFKIATHIPAAAHSQLDKVFGVNVVKDFPK
ncbi:MAG: FAD-dependent monooxygenase [Hellea sp.]